MTQLGGSMDRMSLAAASAPTDPFGRPLIQSPVSEKLSTEPRLAQQQQVMSGFPSPHASQPSPVRPPPGAKMPVAPGYDQIVVPGRPSIGSYEQGSPSPSDAYTTYPVSAPSTTVRPSR
jgi:hypothetical protein